MQHFFVSPEQVKEGKIYVEGGDVNHMKNVLRMKTGEELTVNDGEGSQYLCAVESYEADMAVLKILGKKQDESELASKIYLFQGLPKQDKMELIVQKSVELGAYQEYFAIDGKTLLILCEEGEEEGRTLAADCGQCGEAGRTRYYS